MVRSRLAKRRCWPTRSGTGFRSCSSRRRPRYGTTSPQPGACRRPEARTNGGGKTCWPLELRLKRAEKLLEIAFDDGSRFSLPAEYLRVESPSAEVQGHGAGQKTLVHGRAHVGIMGLEPVGNYAVRITFDDLHDTGLYSWNYLYQLGVEHEQRWREYLAPLASTRFSLEP